MHAVLILLGCRTSFSPVKGKHLKFREIAYCVATIDIMEGFLLLSSLALIVTSSIILFTDSSRTSLSIALTLYYVSVKFSRLIFATTSCSLDKIVIILIAFVVMVHWLTKRT